MVCSHLDHISASLASVAREGPVYGDCEIFKDNMSATVR